LEIDLLKKIKPNWYIKKEKGYQKMIALKKHSSPGMLPGYNNFFGRPILAGLYP
jgi:hypothetical protein